MAQEYNIFHAGRARLVVIDGPLLFDEEELRYGVYVAVAPYGQTTKWPGAVLWMSCDAGATYQRLRDIPRAASIGIAQDALANPPGNPDTTSTVQIHMDNGTLASIAALDLCSNFAVLGSELLQFRDVVENDNNLYTLDHFNRALRGTSGTGHAAGDVFVMVDRDSMVFVPLQSDLVGENLLFKVTTPGMDIDDAPAVSLSPFSGNSRPAWLDDIAASKLLGRGSADGAGPPVEITLGSGLTLTGTTLSASGSGEANTASNQGVGGVGPFDAKVGVDLQFRNLIAGDGSITIVLDAGNKEIEISVPTSGISSSKIADEAVTLAKMQHIGANKLLGRATAGTGDVEELTYPVQAQTFISKTTVAAQRTHLEIPKQNLSASAAPTSADDSGDGYEVGSIWIDTTNDRVYVCVDATAEAAVWRELSATTIDPGRIYTFTAAASGYTTELQVNLFRAFAAGRVDAAHLISAKASTGSNSTNKWESQIKNLTAGTSLCSSVWNSNGSELAAGVAKDLGVNQNQVFAAGDVIAATVKATGAPTSMQHSPWTWSLQVRLTTA